MPLKIFVLTFTTMLLMICSPIISFGQTAARASGLTDNLGDEYDVAPNITYRTANNTELKLDVYTPRNRQQPVPTVMFIHGGGWVEGRKEQDVLLLLPYISMGFAVVNVEYRLARNSPAPAAVEDCRCALRWISLHSKEFNFDLSKIVLTGFSAGGHLALMTGTLPANSPFDHACPTEPSIRFSSGAESPVKVAAIVNWYGITDVADLLEGANSKHYAVEWLGSISNRQELARQLSPLTYVRADSPPVITIHGDADDIVPYSHATQLHAALNKANAPNKLITIRGGKHGGFNKQDTLNNYAAIRDFLNQFKISKREN